MSLIGKIVNHYKILEKIGEGGMGVVYKAEDTKLDRVVALKFLPPHVCANEEEKKRFIHEAKAASRLDHPNICSIYGIEETEDGRLFIVMPYYDGINLKEQIEAGPLSLDEIIDIAFQVAEGLREAHHKTIVHRDIKSANIIVTEKGRVKIMDFGLAKLAGGTKLTKTGTTLGTVAYMSPEQTLGEKVNHRTDIWSLGVVLYEIMTGRLPFRGEYDQAVMYSIMNESPEPIIDLRPEIPESLEQVVCRALEKDPDKRYQDVDAMLDDLRSLSEGIVPDQIRARIRRAKLRKIRRGLLFGGSAGLLIAVAAVLILITKQAQAIDSIAVLPLKNLTGNTEQEYFVDGMTDELIGELGQISGLKRVISRTSVMQYKDTDKSLPDIARELKVDAVMEGTVFEAGDSVRIRFELIDVLPNELNLGGGTYKRAKSEVLMMVSDITQSVASIIQVGLTSEEETRLAGAKQVNPEAYEAYLKGQVYMVTMTPTDLETAMQYFNLALEKNPNSALAYAGISQVWVWYNQMGVVPPNEAVPKAVAAAEKALELDNSLAEVHYALALIKTWGEWNWEEAETAFLRAIEINPNYPDARIFYSHYLIIMKRYEEAIVQMERALELDPFNVMFQALYAADLYYLRRYDETVEMCRHVLRTVPNHWLAVAMLINVSHQKGNYDLTIETTKAFFQLMGLDEGSNLLIRVYEESGYIAAMNSLGEMLEELSQTVPIPPYMIMDQYALAGNKNKALFWFEEAVDSRDPNMIYYGEMPHFVDLLKDEERYRELLRRMNLPVEE